MANHRSSVVPDPPEAKEAQVADGDDSEYRIAYDTVHQKVGCVLIQAILGGDVPRELFFDYFDAGTWTVDAKNCRVYPIRRSQLSLLSARTITNGGPSRAPVAPVASDASPRKTSP